MILGVGIDLIEVDRIAGSVERFGERFLNRILCPGEIAYCRTFKHPHPHIAARFAAKEAVSKAFGTGIGAALGWRDIEVEHQPSGAPFIILHGAGAELLRQRQASRVWLSLSHTAHYATAMAVLEA